MTEMTLTLDKAELLKELEEKRAEVFESFAKKEIEELEELLTSVVSKETVAGLMADYYEDIVEGLRSERYQIGGNGQVKGAPAKPKVGSISVRSHRRSHYSHYSEDDLKRSLQGYKANRDEAVKPLDAAIRLLNMSKETEVVIASGDYQDLLAGPSTYGRRFY